MSIRRSLIVVSTLLAACSATTSGSVEPMRAVVLEQPSEVLVPLPDGRLLGEQGGVLVLLDPRRLTLDPVVIGPASDVGDVHAAVPLESAILVLASRGTFVLRESAWVPSPLADSLDGPIRAAVMLPPELGMRMGDLWIATDRSLVRVTGDQVRPFALDEPLEGVRLAAVRRPEGPALWVLLEDRVLEIWRDRTGATRSASLVLPAVPDAIAGDATGTGWLSIDGRLHSIGSQRVLVDHGLPASRLLGSNQSEELWVFPNEGPPVLRADGAFFEVTGVDARRGDRLALGIDGSLYQATEAVHRFAPRRDVVIEGAPDGALLVEPQVFRIRAQGAPSIEATVGDTALEVSSDPLGVALVPADIGAGEHVLTIRVSYDDGTLPIEEQRTFDVITNATWTDDVEPLNILHCASCHGPEGAANTRLGTREEWMNLSTIILDNVEEQRMPLNRPPLSQREIALIQAWTISGFPE